MALHLDAKANGKEKASKILEFCPNGCNCKRVTTCGKPPRLGLTDDPAGSATITGDPDGSAGTTDDY